MNYSNFNLFVFVCTSIDFCVSLQTITRKTTHIRIPRSYEATKICQIHNMNMNVATAGSTLLRSGMLMVSLAQSGAESGTLY